VINPDDEQQKTDIMKNIFDEIKLSPSITKFYKQICNSYIGITREESTEFFNNQNKQHTLTQQMKHRTNKPIVAYHVNQLWCIDLLDLNPFVKRKDNKNYRYIMNVIDVFSRKIFLSALKNKTAVNTMNGLKTIIEKYNVKPFYILCDSGAEFKGEFEKFCEEQYVTEPRASAKNITIATNIHKVIINKESDHILVSFLFTEYLMKIKKLLTRIGL
jgi:hypothetical protein